MWKPSDAANGYWNGATVTKLWDGAWDDLSPYLLTRTELKGKPVSYHNSRANSILYGELVMTRLFVKCWTWFGVVGQGKSHVVEYFQAEVRRR